MNIDRQLIEALKLSPYVKIIFEYGDKPAVLNVRERLFSHDVGIAVQSYYLRELKKKR